MPIDHDVAALACADNFAAFTTMLPSGQPMTHVMWVDCDEGHVLMNTEVHRQKYKNVEHDLRVTVTIITGPTPTASPRYGARWWRRCGARKHAATSTS